MKRVMKSGRLAIETLRREGRSRWTDSVIRRGLKAWLDELLGLLPPALAARLDRRACTRLWPPTSAPETARPVTLLLPATHAMVQRITLPAAATRSLHRVLRYELGRYFPYEPEALHFVARVLRKRDERAEVELVAVARERLDAMLATCDERGLRLQAIDVIDAEGERLGVDLLPAGAAARAPRAVRLDRWLGATCLVLLLALAAAYLHHERQRLETMQATVDGQREQVRHLQSLRHELDATVGAARYLGERKASRATLSELLAELTGCLGDEEWISELSLENGREVTFSGQSERASALIAQVRRCPSLEQARFQGVIQSDDATGRERYSIRARLRDRDPTSKERNDATADRP